MPNNTQPTIVTTDRGGNGAVTALLAILVIAIIAFGIWYAMRHSGTAPATGSNAGLQVNVGTNPSGSGTANQ